MSIRAGKNKSNDPIKLVGTLRDYDLRQFPFPELFEECVAGFLKKKGLGSVRQLSQIHKVIDFKQLSELMPWLYKMINEPEFQKLYRRYIEKVIAPLFPDSISYQWVPNPRVQLPKGKTVQYHTDEWYGHGTNMFNFWLPMTPAYGSNTLLAASLRDSVMLCRQFEREKSPQQRINQRSAAYVRPIECRPGQLFIFNARCIHGTEQNQTPDTRISMDFRILREGDSSGDKPLTAYYRSLHQTAKQSVSLSPSAKPSHAAAYVYPRYGFTRYVSQPHQRLIIDAYAKKMNAMIVDEETEIRTMPHHPALLQLATGSGLEKINMVILFSVLCLPPNREDRKKILRTAQSSGVRLCFASESLCFPTISSAADIESHYQRLSDA